MWQEYSCFPATGQFSGRFGRVVGVWGEGQHDRVPVLPLSSFFPSGVDYSKVQVLTTILIYKRI